MNSLVLAQRHCLRIEHLLSISTRTSFFLSNNHQKFSPPVLQVNRSPRQTCPRHFWETFPHFRPVLHLKDGLDRETHELVYRCGLFNYGFYAQLGAMCTFAAQVFYGIFHAYNSAVNNVAPITTFGGFAVTYDLASLAIIGLFTVQNIALYYLAQRLLLRVYYKENTDEYVFVSLSSNPFKSRFTYCGPKSVKSLNRNNLMAIFGNFKTKDRVFYMKYDKFSTLFHFNKLLNEPCKVE